jgi:hypothetical protein
MIVHLLHGRTHLPLLRHSGCGQTRSVRGSSIHHHSYPEVLVRPLFPEDPPITISALQLWPQQPIQRPFYVCDSTTPFKTHNC